MLASKAIGMVVKADDVHALQKDLQKDFVIKSTLLNRVAREAKKNQNHQQPLLRKKRRQRTPAAESTAICFLALEAWLSPL